MVIFACPELTIALSDPELPYGRLDVLYDGTKGTVCADDFDDFDANIVCKSMGFYKGTVSLPVAV